MADNSTKAVILDVEVNGSQAVKNIADLTTKVDALRSKQDDLKKSNSDLKKSQNELIKENTNLAEKMTGLAKSGQITAAEYAAMSEQFEKNSQKINANKRSIDDNRVSMAANAEEIKVLNKEIASNSKAVQDTVKENQNAAGSYNQLSAQLSQLKVAYKAAASDEERKAILKDLVKVNDRLVELDEQQHVWVRNVGNYKGAMLDAFSSLPGPIGATASAAKGFGGALKVISTTPVIGILQLLLPLIVKLVSAFKNNAAAMEAVNQAFAAFSGVGVIIDKVIGKIAEGITWLAGKLGKFAEKIGLVTAEMKESNRITQEEIRLEKQRRDAVVANAKAENEIAKLKAESADKQNHTVEQRIKMYQRAGELEKEIMERDLAIAQAEYELIKAKNAQSESTMEDMMKEAEAEAKVIQVRTNLFNKQKEINSQLTSMRNEIATAEKAATAATEKKAKADEKAATDKAKNDKSLLDLELAKYETEIGVTRKYTQESYDRHIQYYDDLAALYEKDSTEYNQALAAKEKYQSEFNKQVEERAKKHDEIMSQYGLIGSDKAALNKQLTDLQSALDAAIISEEEYAQAVATIYSDIALSKSKSVVDMASQVMDIVSTIGGAVEEQENAELEQYKNNQEERKNELAKRLEMGLISQEQYNGKVAQIDAETAKKEKELQLQQAKRQKAMAIMNATLNAAGAIIASLAASPVAYGPIPNPAGIASLALATATGIAQVAAAVATPLPKASRGALLHGKSHAQGGIPIEAEGGEAIINKKATQRYLPLLSAINESTGGVRLFGKGGTVGAAVKNAAVDVIDYDRLANVLSQMNVQVAVTDINDGQSQMARVVERKNY